MSPDSIFIEGYALTDPGHMVGSVYADMRVDGNHGAITPIVKRCRREHAIEAHRKVRLSQPSVFRS